MKSAWTLGVVLTVALLAAPAPVFAYAGPGAGLSVIGAALALVGGIVLGVFGFVWYPLKRLFRWIRKAREPSEGVGPP